MHNGHTSNSAPVALEWWARTVDVARMLHVARFAGQDGKDWR